MESAEILVVEDEKITARDLERTLLKGGHSVVGSVATGEEAVSQAISLMPDLVLMDIILDGEMDGISAAGYIRDRSRIPIVYLTAHADPRTIERARLTEPSGYLLKPFQDSELYAAVQMALYRSRRESSGKAVAQMAEVRSGEADSAPDPITAVEFLRSLEFFSALAPRELAVFAEACELCEVASGESIIVQGDPDPGAFIVVEGRLAQFSGSADGHQLTVELLPPGDLLGLVSALEFGKAPLTTRAQVPSKVLWIPKSTFLLLLDSHPNLGRRFCQYIVLRLRRSHSFSMAMAHSQVAVRVATALLSLVPRVDVDTSEPCEVRVTRQELADCTGAAVETVVRVTKEFERRGILSLGERRKIRITDLKKLEQICREGGP